MQIGAARALARPAAGHVARGTTISSPATASSVRNFVNSAERNSATQRFWAWSTRPEPERVRWSRDWWADAALKCTVFAITGTTSVTLVRPALAKCGLEGSLKDGPNSYRVLSLLCVSPIYTLILLTVGTLAGRHNYFAKVAQRMWGRLLPKSVVNKLLCPPAKPKL